MFKTSGLKVSFIFIICALVRHSLAVCTTAFCPLFGEDNNYLCECAGNVACDTDTGKCPAECEDGYFGPACQYVLVGYTEKDGSDINWLRDNIDTTCNDGTSQTITVTLDSSTLLTWIRLSFKESGQKNGLQISYTVGESTTECAMDKTVKVDDTTLDISCPTSEAVSDLTLSGIGALCSLYISGGRNIALMETNITQSSTLRPFVASNAVNGRWSTSNPEHCSHTDGGGEQRWWALTFPGLYKINKIEVYNRKDCCSYRLVGFTLRIYDEKNNAVYNYTDPNTPALLTYTISSIGVRNGKRIEVILANTEEELTLCEVEVFGESGCASGFYGLECENHCNCADGGDCFDHSGGCPSGCAAGYTGQDCTTPCSQGTYGVDCRESCSVYCDGDENTCSTINGTCDLGCQAGYQLPLCKEVCSTGFYGQYCTQRCNEFCFGDDNSCNHVTGSCDQGCDNGYQLPECENICSTGEYGRNCTEKCSTHCLGNKTCDYMTGSCDEGCEIGYKFPVCKDECDTGYFGQDCETKCNDFCFGDDNNCHHVTGECVNGCDPGYTNPFCGTECEAGSYGINCTETCSENCAGVDKRCSHVDGSCDEGCIAGYTLPNCTKECDANSTQCGPGLSEDMSGGGGGGDGGAVIGAVVGAIVGLLVIIAIIGAIFFWRRRNASNGCLKSGEKEPEDPFATTGTANNEPKENHDYATIDSDEPETSLSSPTAIPVVDLKAYLVKHATDNLIDEQFKSVPQTSEAKTSHGELAENKKKNRFLNIWPYDKNRVVLTIREGKPHSDYINATHIKNFKNSRNIIASQGPNDFMLNDFLRMLWEKNVDQIVMLTNVVEKAKRKCSQYWPMEGVESFGAISVELLTTRVFAEYTIRHLRLSRDGERGRDVTQYHFTAWPDKSVPDSPWGLVDLYHRVMAGAGSGTLLVHCSAGCGRTGTFIAMHHLLREAAATGKMDFLSTLKRLRADRTQMVQTLAQYKLLHQAALIGHMTLGTIIPVRDMFGKLQALESRGNGSKTGPTRNGFSEEFTVTELCADLGETTAPAAGDDEYANSRTATNKLKNRLSNILPKESHRAALLDDDVKGNIYINAVMVPNFTKDRHDLLTQLPLPNTVTDFWRLVSMYHVSLMVAFDADCAESDETIGTFLPENVSDVFEDGVFEVTLTEREDTRQWQELKLAVCKKQDSQKAKPRFVTCLLVKTTELDSSNWLDILNKVNTCRPAESLTSLYMCRNGATYSGLACVQSILLDRLEVDQCLAVPLVVGAIKAIRPQVIPTMDQYKLLYEVLRQSHDATNVYGNVDDGGSVVPLKPTRPVSSSAVLQPSTNNYEDVDGVMLQARQLAMKQRSVQDRPLRDGKPGVKPAAPTRPNNAESKSEQIVTASAPPKLKKERHVQGDKPSDAVNDKKSAANVKANTVDANITPNSRENHRASAPTTVDKERMSYV